MHIGPGPAAPAWSPSSPAAPYRTVRAVLPHTALRHFVERGRGCKPSIPKEKIDVIADATLHSTPPGETHWSCRSMAKAQGVSPATVQRVWSATAGNAVERKISLHGEAIFDPEK